MENNENDNDEIINLPSSNIIKDKTIEDKLLLTLNIIKKDIYNFISKYIKNGFYFNIKLNEKNKKIKVFVTLINNSDTNYRNDDIDFLIEINEEYPKRPPMVFCLSCVRSFFIIII